MLYINGRFLTQQMSGVQRYAYELCKALRVLGVNFTIVMPNKKAQNCYDLEGWNVIKWGLGNSHLWEQLLLPLFFLFKSNSILVNFTGLGPWLVFDKIMTIHDLAFYENPSWYSKWYVLLYKFLTPLCIKTSKAILTVSEFSKREIVRWLHVEDSKIHIIYNSSTFRSCVGEKPLINIPDKYFLAVSSIDPRKNFERLINVFSKLPNYNLIVVGGSYHVFKPITLQGGGGNIVFTGRVSDDVLVYLYRNAFAFIYPSLYEGFGIPPIEAMSYGCPVIASDIEVLHEVCGDAALYANPCDDKAIVEKIVIVSSSDTIRDELKKKSAENVKRFSWISSAEKLKIIIESL